MRMDEKRTPKRLLEWKPIGRRTRRRPRKRWIEEDEEDIQRMGGGECYVRKGRNRRESLRRLKPTGGCNASKRRRRLRNHISLNSVET